MQIELTDPRTPGEEIHIVCARAAGVVATGRLVGLPKELNSWTDPRSHIRRFPLKLCGPEDDPLGVALTVATKDELFWAMTRGPVSIKTAKGLPPEVIHESP